MKFYYCKRCNYNTENKTKYDRHCKTQKHLQLIKSHHLDNQKVKIFNCDYCKKTFTTKQSMYRHIKYTCKQNKDDNLKELVHLMNEKIIEQNKRIDNMKQSLNIKIHNLKNETNK